MGKQMAHAVKCIVLKVTQKLNPTYRNHTQLLSYVNEAKYLGLLLDNKLTFNKHIDCICKKANSALAFTSCADPAVFLKIIKSLYAMK